MSNNEKNKSGFVALIGRPNVGKSTLMNYLVGQKVAITSNKPQTTRNKISGIYTTSGMQVIFVDTPGIFKPHGELDDYMDKASLSSLNDVDLILFMVEPEKMGKGDEYIVNLLQQVKVPAFLLINKVDQVNPNDLLGIIDEYRQLNIFKEFLPISATQGIGISDLNQVLYDYLPEGPAYYDPEQITDRPEYFMVSELIREQLLNLTAEEVPHAAAVWVEQMNQHENNKLQIEATIYVEKSGQKGIIIGKGGKMLKQIGINSRKQIEDLLGEKVNLHLWVKVQRNWRSDPRFLKQIGYNKKDLS
ncbi:GTPase Era [Lactobacillus sp. ESL0236]|uniref:GTPase Era n=1 Tax=unclassified Lactobacillus TaxID=2620435 RepID=UPI000EFD9514|nr:MULTISPECIES: GTPase Era [unclassified Lactobacillus]RMC39989.1 GTPase Era [Lactobacillus sp. ESL0237]RMC44150.1 GTPase Era [Lactobacillus sp. ESL0234]RMC45478.1 GTPase Era [Lactobacillus sp. ESL0236]